MFNPQATADGSFTFFSPEFEEAFHSSSGAKQEAEQKFCLPCQLPHLAAQRESLTLLDVCYGLGYNSAAALAMIWSVNPRCQIQLIALELDPEVPRQAIAHGLLTSWPELVVKGLSQLAEHQTVNISTLSARLYLGDARQTLTNIAFFEADAIFLDPFSPPKCPQLWSVEFIALLAQRLSPHAYLATYSCAASVRTALTLAGLKFGPTPQVGRRSPGTLAHRNGDMLAPLSLAEQEHLQTKAAIPYRDPYLRDDAQTILERRRQEQSISTLEPSSHWKKRWQARNKEY